MRPFISYDFLPRQRWDGASGVDMRQSKLAKSHGWNAIQATCGGDVNPCAREQTNAPLELHSRNELTGQVAGFGDSLRGIDSPERKESGALETQIQ